MDRTEAEACNAAAGVETPSLPRRLAVIVLAPELDAPALDALRTIAQVMPRDCDMAIVAAHAGMDLRQRIEDIAPGTRITADGINAGVRSALARGATHVLFLTADARPTPDALDAAQAALDSDPRSAAVGVKNLIAENPTLVWGRYGTLSWGPLLAEVQGRLEEDGLFEGTKEVDWVLLNGSLFRREAFEHVGLFDEHLNEFGMEIDWAVRARACGYRILYTDRAAVLRPGLGTIDRANAVTFPHGYYLARNAMLIARKHATAGQWIHLLASMGVAFVIRTLFHASYDACWAIFDQRTFVRGVRDGFSGRLSRDRITARRRSVVLSPRQDGMLRRFLRWSGV